MSVISEQKENKVDSKMDIFNDIFDSESECQEKSNDSQALSNIDLDEISEFVDNISEILEEFVDEAFENEEEGLYEYDGSIECAIKNGFYKLLVEFSPVIYWNGKIPNTVRI